MNGSKDSTFAFLAMLWSALYAWDQALEALYEHFSWLVSKSSYTTGSVDLCLVSFVSRRP